MDLGELGWGDVDWIVLAQDNDRWRALANSIMNLRVPQNAGKLSSGLKTGLHTVSQSVKRTSVWRCTADRWRPNKFKNRKLHYRL
jgi:hypothetical protein